MFSIYENVKTKPTIAEIANMAVMIIFFIGYPDRILGLELETKNF
jgi:hypothetical protein